MKYQVSRPADLTPQEQSYSKNELKCLKDMEGIYNEFASHTQEQLEREQEEYEAFLLENDCNYSPQIQAISIPVAYSGGLEH
jgi:hypothetical protein